METLLKQKRQIQGLEAECSMLTAFLHRRMKLGFVGSHDKLKQKRNRKQKCKGLCKVKNSWKFYKCCVHRMLKYTKM